MNDFLNNIRNLKDTVEEVRKADEAAKLAAELARKQAIHNEQVSATLELARWMGIEADETMLSGYCLNRVTVGNWSINFQSAKQGNFGTGTETSHYWQRYIRDGQEQTSEKDAEFVRYWFTVEFIFDRPTISNSDRVLIQKFQDVYDGREHGKYAHPLEKCNNHFKLQLCAEAPITAPENAVLNERLRLQMAGQMLDIEEAYGNAVTTSEAWRMTIRGKTQELLDELHEQAYEVMARDLQREADYQAWLEEENKAYVQEETQLAATPRYSFSGETLGEILEQVIREMKAQEIDY